MIALLARSGSVADYISATEFDADQSNSVFEFPLRADMELRAAGRRGQSGERVGLRLRRAVAREHGDEPGQVGACLHSAPVLRKALERERIGHEVLACLGQRQDVYGNALALGLGAQRRDAGFASVVDRLPYKE